MKNAILKNRLMKRFPLIILVAVAIAFAVAMQKPTLFNNGKSDYAIVLCKNASTSEQTAAKELQGMYQTMLQDANTWLKDAHDKVDGLRHERDYYQKDRNELREKMEKANKNVQDQTPKPKKPVSAKKLHLGDAVKVLSMNLKGTVSSLPDAKGDLFVQMGILRSKVNISDLELIDEVTVTAPSLTMTKTSTGKIKMSKSASVSTEINLIGMTVDEALAHLDKYLDDAYLAHMPSVRIVHGKGTGKLREAVQRHLKKCKYVKSYRMGEFGEGDAGVTIAEFKK